MSVKRYMPGHHRSYDNGMAEAQSGDYVLHSDYAALEAELKKVKAERDAFTLMSAKFYGFTDAAQGFAHNVAKELMQEFNSLRDAHEAQD